MDLYPLYIWTLLFFEKIPEWFQNVLERSNVSGRRMLYMTKKIKIWKPIGGSGWCCFYYNNKETYYISFHNRDRTIEYFSKFLEDGRTIIIWPKLSNLKEQIIGHLAWPELGWLVFAIIISMVPLNILDLSSSAKEVIGYE